MKRLLRYIARYWHRYAFGILCTLATAALGMAIPYLVRDAINAIQSHDYAQLAFIVKLICAAAILGGVARWFSRFVIFNCGRDIEYNLRNDLFAHLVKLGPDFYERLKTGDLMSRLVNDLTAVRMMIGMGVLSFTTTPLMWVLSLTVMLSLSPRLTLASIAPYLVLFFVMYRLSRSIMERSLRVQEGIGAIGAKIQESLSGIHIVKAYTLEEHQASQFRELNHGYNELGLALARIRGVLLPLINGADRRRHDDRADLRRRAGDGASHLDRRPGGVHELPGGARLADHVAGLDDFALSTRQGLDEAAERNFRKHFDHHDR